MKTNKPITMKTKHALCGLLSGLLLLAAGTTTTHASLILGPGVATAGGSTDSIPSTNVDRLVTGFLAAGTYDVTNFDVRINVFGGGRQVVPFLAIGAPSTYTTIWFGPTFIPTSTGVQNILYTPSTQQFTLLSGQTVYAGFDHVGPSSVDLSTSGGNTDIKYGIDVTSVGQTLTAFGVPGNSQKYSFDIVVEAVPEPGTALLLGIGCVGVAALRRRRSA